jgi:uncharacterized membrane protein
MNERLPKLRALLKGHFFAGLLVLIPIGVIAWIIVASVRGLWELHELLPESWQPEVFFPNPTLAALFNVGFTVGLAAVLAIWISILGWASKQFLGRKVLETLGWMIERIPVIRSIYSALEQLMRTVGSGGGQQFSRVVYIEYPRKGIWTLAFVTSAARGPVAVERSLNVYVPTTPNPTSGFYLIVPETEVREAQMRVEEAFRTILSLGIAQPAERAPHG